MAGTRAAPAIGGQAVLGGVMMRSSDRWSLAVRRPDGTIDLTVHDVPGYLPRLRAIPVVRGVVALVDTLVLGTTATVRSSRVRDGGRDRIHPAEVLAVVLGLSFAVGAFGLLPAYLARVAGLTGAAFHLAEAAVRIALLVGYLAALGRSSDIRGVWRNHGAEHKTVNAHEAGLDLTVGTVRGQSIRHVRCGTTFLLVVAVMAMGFHAIVGEPDTTVLLASRVLGLPLVAAASYELIRAAGRGAWWARPALRPGLWLQSLTTEEPTDDEIEVAVLALRALVAEPVTAPAPALEGVAA